MYEVSKRRISTYEHDLAFTEIARRFPSQTDQWLYYHHYFWNIAPEWLREHRAYFRHDNRGFGEDAFHAMWYLLLRERRPSVVLEIGVYRGQVVSLWALVARELGFGIEIHGISPFTSAGDLVSIYPTDLDYYQDVLDNFARFGLEAPYLHRGLSNDPSIVDVIRSQPWDLAYIDGNHDYEVVKADFANLSFAVRRGGLIVLDDAALHTRYRPLSFATAGHAGPSRVAKEVDADTFPEIGSAGHNRVFQRR